MAKPEEKLIDFDDREQKRNFLSKCGVITGKWWFSARPFKRQRSLKANARYWAGVVPAWQEFMRKNGQHFNKDEVHEFFLQMFAGREVADPKTGVVFTVIGRRSSKMDSAQFSKFTNDCEDWMLEKWNVTVPDIELYQPAAHSRKREVAA
jgi:hypothetical protein